MIIPHIAVDIGGDIQASADFLLVFDPGVAAVEFAAELVGRGFQVFGPFHQPIFAARAVEFAVVERRIVTVYEIICPVFNSIDDNFYLPLFNNRPRASRLWALPAPAADKITIAAAKITKKLKKLRLIII